MYACVGTRMGQFETITSGFILFEYFTQLFTNKIKVQDTKPLSCKYFSKDLTILHLNSTLT